MKHLKFFVFLCILTFTVSCGQQKRFIQYKVKKGETMSKIAQKLNMSKAKLVRLNPDVTGEPAANSFLVVPEQNLVAFKKQVKPKSKKVKDALLDSLEVEENDSIENAENFLEALKKKFDIYEVTKGDTFYNIEKRFGINRQELLLLNPELQEGLKLGMLLKLREKEQLTGLEDDYYMDFIDPNKNVKVALLLPFKAYKYQVDTLTLKEIFVQDAALLNIATDFYLGAEIAIDSIRNKGVPISFEVFDTGERNSGAISRIVATQDLNRHDVVIGPLYSSEVQTVAANVAAPVIFPVYSKNQAQFSYTNIVKTAPEKSLFREVLATYIKDNYEEGANLIIVSDESMSSVQDSNTLRMDIEMATDTMVQIIQPNEGYIAKERFLELLKPNTNNWVIMATNNQVIASDAINSLISLPEETTARVFAFNKGKIYDKIDNLKLAKLGFTYVSDEYEDTSSLASSTFNSMYLKKNKTLPSYYATKGFDITYDIVMRLASGKSLTETFLEGVSKRVETKFEYRTSESLSENRGVFLLKYNEDLTLSQIK